MFGSETQFVEWLRRMCRVSQPGLAVGIGDDAAVVRPGASQDVILTTDISLESVHFLPRLHPARAVGHRALARGLSDIAAMGGKPRFALLSLAISRGTTGRWVKEFYSGALAIARRTGVAIIGGDTSVVSGPVFVDAVVAGEVPRGTALLRSGARPGDLIYVSGCLGLSALGLSLLKSNSPAVLSRLTDPSSEALRAHLYPEPRLGLGQFLRKNRLASALMDLSDGLSTDLPRLCDASGVGAVLYQERIPSPAPPKGSKLSLAELLEFALNGGEDYELLFTIPRGKAGKIPRSFRTLPITCIGEVRHSQGIFIASDSGKLCPLASRGFEHFRDLKRRK